MKIRTEESWSPGDLVVIQYHSWCHPNIYVNDHGELVAIPYVNDNVTYLSVKKDELSIAVSVIKSQDDISVLGSHGAAYIVSVHHVGWIGIDHDCQPY